MPRTLLLVRTIILLHDVLVIGEAVPTESMRAPRACSVRNVSRCPSAKYGVPYAAMDLQDKAEACRTRCQHTHPSILPSTRAADAVAAGPRDIASPAELGLALETYGDVS